MKYFSLLLLIGIVGCSSTTITFDTDNVNDIHVYDNVLVVDEESLYHGCSGTVVSYDKGYQRFIVRILKKNDIVLNRFKVDCEFFYSRQLKKVEHDEHSLKSISDISDKETT